MDDIPIPLKVFCERYSWPSSEGMRQYIFKEKQHGLEGCFIRIGRRVLIYPKRFFERMEKNNHARHDQ